VQARVVYLEEISAEVQKALLLTGSSDAVWANFRQEYLEGRIIIIDERLLGRKPCLN
jgi:hypothetical protein